MQKIKGVALIALVISAMIFAAFPELLIPLSKAADSGWTLTSDSSNIKAYPNLHEYVWQKNASMAPNSIIDKIGLHRLVKIGTTPSEVIFIMPSAFSSQKNSVYGTNSPDENWTKSENQSQAIYWANRGFDVYTMETRDYFVSQNFNLSQYAFNTTQLSFMANWGWDQWISDMKEAVSKTKEVSGFQKVFMAGVSDGGEAVLNYATQNWKQDIRGIILLDAQIYGGKAAQLVAKTGGETNTYNLTKTLNEVNANGTYFKEFGGVAGWVVLAQYAEANPEALPINPWTGLWLNSTARNSFTGKNFANITDWFASIFSLLGIANFYGGVANITITIHNFANHLRYAPNRLTIESQAMKDWVNCPYLTFDFDDHWSEIGVPTLVFASGSYTNSTGTFRFINGINNNDFTGITLLKYMNMDTFIGINSSNEVSEPVYQWMISHYLPFTAVATPTTLTVETGQIATFNVNASGTVPPYTYQWYQESNLLTGQTKSQISLPTTKNNENGQFTYYCKITDSENKTTNSNAVTLIVKNPQLTPTASPLPKQIPTQTPQPTSTPTASPTPSPTPTQSPQNHGLELAISTIYTIVSIAGIIVIVAAVALISKKRTK
jgi:pimeloyl-ACP methyl ester carboxylesterase